MVIASSLAAVFVVSPIAVYSTRRSDPTCPVITSPLLTPIPIAKPSPSPSDSIHRLKAASRGPAISRAAASARSAWSGCSSGAPNTAMIPSPMNETSVPPWSMIASVIPPR